MQRKLDASIEFPDTVDVRHWYAPIQYNQYTMHFGAQDDDDELLSYWMTVVEAVALLNLPEFPSAEYGRWKSSDSILRINAKKFFVHALQATGFKIAGHLTIDPCYQPTKDDTKFFINKASLDCAVGHCGNWAWFTDNCIHVIGDNDEVNHSPLTSVQEYMKLRDSVMSRSRFSKENWCSFTMETQNDFANQPIQLRRESGKPLQSAAVIFYRISNISYLPRVCIFAFSS